MDGERREEPEMALPNHLEQQQHKTSKPWYMVAAEE
jgi:hypothetical protein